MSFAISNRVILITGASGIAASTAMLAAESGARVFFVANNEEQCVRLAESLAAIGAESDYRVADLSISA